MERAKEMRELLKTGKIPYTADVELMEDKAAKERESGSERGLCEAQGKKKDVPMPVGMEAIHPWLCGQVAGASHGGFEAFQRDFD